MPPRFDAILVCNSSQRRRVLALSSLSRELENYSASFIAPVAQVLDPANPLSPSFNSSALLQDSELGTKFVTANDTVRGRSLNFEAVSQNHGCDVST